MTSPGAESGGPTGRDDASAQDGSSGSRRRILGVDVARALAIIGMVAVHFGPTDVETFAGRLYALPHGRAAVLFVLLAGVGATLLAGDRSPARLRAARGQLGWRALVLLPLGLALAELDHGVLVILQYYALYFLVAALALGLRDRQLLWGTGLLAAAAPFVYLWLWHLRPEWFDRGPTTWGEPVAVTLRQLVLSGSYPVLVWSAPLLLGVWLGRCDLRAALTHWRMLSWGLLAAIGGATTAWGLTALLGEPVTEPSWALLLVDDPHSEMPLWLLGSTGSAVAVLGACLIVSARLPRITWPVAATGQLAFTLYVGHVLALDRRPDLLRFDEVGAAAASVARFAAVAIAASTLWRLLAPRGPLELALRPPWRWRRVKGDVPGSAPPRAG
jgi:uncharacterized membrane protein YeiB